MKCKCGKDLILVANLPVDYKFKLVNGLVVVGDILDDEADPLLDENSIIICVTCDTEVSLKEYEDEQATA